MVGSKEAGQLELGFCLGFVFRVRVRVRLKNKVTWGLASFGLRFGVRVRIQVRVRVS